MTESSTSLSKSLVSEEEVLSEQQLVKRSLSFLFSSALFVLVIFFVSTRIWHYFNQQQLNDLKQSAKRSLALYGSKIEHELDQVQQNLLPILANHPSLQLYLNYPSLSNRQQAQKHIQHLQSAMQNRVLFIGNAKLLMLASEHNNTDKTMLDSMKKTISSRAFKQKKTEQFIFSRNKTLAKYLIAIPILSSRPNSDSTLISKPSSISLPPESTSYEVTGYIGLLIDLSQLQEELTRSLLTKDQVVLMSDQRGIIMLSSEANWLYQTFSNLPYSLKKDIDQKFAQKQLFNQLGIANIDNDILSITADKSHPEGQSFLAHSNLLSNHQLRIHHLANIAPINLRSNFTVAFILTCIVLLMFLGLLFKEKRQALFAQHQYDRERKDLDIEFKQQQKLASMGMMATNIAHEINQPITAIKTEAKIGNKFLERENYQEAEQSFTTIVKYTRLLAAITSQLKDFARKRNSSHYNVANIQQVFQQSLTLNNSRLTDENVQCKIDKFDGQLQAKIDQHQLQQILTNLLQNACDAMKDSTRKSIEISVKEHSSTIEIFFSDNGPGIPENILPTIFDPFVSSKEDASSMGLGLAICHDILNRVGGNIEILTEKVNAQHGAHFKISLVKITPQSSEGK